MSMKKSNELILSIFIQSEEDLHKIISIETIKFKKM